MKKIIYFSISFMLIFVLSSCSTNVLRITILMYDQADPFLYSYSKNIESVLDGLYEVKLIDCSLSQTTQNEYIIATLDTTDIFVINLVDRISATSIVQKIKQQDIPIVFYNREPLESVFYNQEDVYFVGGDPVSDGKLQAQVINELYNEDQSLLDKNGDGVIKTVVLKGESNHQDAESRTESSLSELAEYGLEIEVLNTYICDWSADLAYAAGKKIIDNYQEEVELILSNNDEMAVGVINYLQEIEVFEESYDDIAPYVIVGVDGIDSGLAEVSSGTMYATIYNDKETQTTIISKLISCIVNDDIVNEVIIDHEIINGHFIYVTGQIITRDILL